MRIRPPIAWIDAWPRSPAVAIAIAMGGGVVVGRLVLPAYPWIWFAVAGLMLLGGALRLDRERLSSQLLLASVLFAAIAATQLAAFRFPGDHLTHFIADTPRLCQLRLYLPHEPRLRGATMFGERYATPPRQSTLASVTHVLTRAGWMPATGDVLLQISQPLSELHAGQTIELIGLAERPGLAMNPGQFDWQRYYRDLGVLNSVNVRRRQNIRIVSAGPAPLVTRWRESIRELFDAGFDPDRKLDHALLSALLLGDYDPELRDVKDDFRRTGTSHHLAISGMHVAVVGGLAFLLFRLVGFGPRACWLAGLIVVLLYGAAATPSPPVLRAVILFSVAGGAFLVARFAGVLQMLALTVALMLATRPLDLFNAGFQLSFGTVLGLVLLSEPLAKRWSREEEDVVLLPEEIARMTPGIRLIRWADRAGVRVLAAGVAAWLVSMPLIAARFEQLNPWQVVTSILLAPLVTFSLLAGIAKVIGTWLLPALAGPLAGIATTSSAWMRNTVGMMATWPYGDVPLAAPPAWVVGMCWVALGIVVVRWRLTTVRIAALTLLIVTFGYMLIGPYWFGSPNLLKPGELRVTLMAVGAGQCALIEAHGGRVAMLDCGSTSLTDLTGNVVGPVLRARGQTNVDTMLISHANTDHYSGIAEIAETYGTREVMVADGFERDAAETDSGERMLTRLRGEELAPRVVRPGDKIPLASDATIEVLGPGAAMDNANDRSLVVRLRKGDRTILFTGDIQAGGMQALLNADAPGLKSDVLVAMHHGSSEDVTPTFVEAVEPAWTLSSNDRTPSGKQKRFDAMMAGRRLLRTNEYGAITIVIGRDGAMRVEGFVKSP